MQKITFNFYNVWVSISSATPEVIERVQKDFAFFLTKDPGPKGHLHITTKFESLDTNFLKKFKKRKSSNCDMYDDPPVRWNDYFGKALVQFDFLKESAIVYSQEIDALHEITYLVTLSRVGKALDMQGLHRIHAMSAIINNVCVTCSMHMGNGKTSLLLESLKDPKTLWLSDDSPLISRNGEALSFPLRIGITSSWLAQHRDTSRHLDFSQLYDISRMKYGRKHLIPISAISNPIASKAVPPELILLGNKTDSTCQITPISAWRAFPILFLNLNIGLGLPMMREYFFEPGLKSPLNVVKIFFSRLMTVLYLMRHSRFAHARLSPNPSNNLKVLYNFLETNFPPQEIEL